MLLLVDLDGVVHRGWVPVSGMPELLTERAAGGDIIVYVTNNARWHRDEHIERLTALGVPVGPASVVTSARGTALVLAADEPSPAGVMVLGSADLRRELGEVGLRTVGVTADGLATGPDVLVAGLDVELSYERLSLAATAIRAGARFVATNRDPVFPSPDGFQAGAGALVAALSVAGGRDPDLVVGKPEPTLFRVAAESVGGDASRAIVIGDGLGTDILAARRVGATAVLMLTGVSSRADAEQRPADERPHHIAADATELRDLLDRLG